MSETKKIVNKSKDVFGATSSSLETLENSFSYYKDLLGNFSNGTTKIELRKRNMLRILDEDWVIAMEDYLPAVDAIIRNPSGSLDDFDEIKPIELTRKVTSRSVIHLSQHTDYINEIKKDGTVMPAKLLNVYQDESMLNYENKFLNTLILRVYSFVMLRYDAICDCAEDGKDISFSYDQKFEEGDRKGTISIKIEVTDPVEQAEIEKNYSTVSDLWRRVNRIVDMAKSIMSSRFVKTMGKNYIKPPIMKTNKLLKNVNFNQALLLWEFIDNYENVGYHTIVDERLEDCSNEFLAKFYDSVVAQYVLFQKTINPEFSPENELAAIDNVEIDPRFKDEFDNNIERELDVTDLIPNKEPEQKIEETGHEDAIDFAIEVALAADDLLFKDVEEEIRPYRFSYSFLGRLILAQDPAQDYYTRIKNKLLSYSTVSSNISWKHELFKASKDKVCKLTMRGKTLCVFLPLDPNDYVDTKYIYEDLTNSKANKDVPFMMKITSDRKCKWAIELIEVVMKKLGLELDPNFKPKDYHRPYMTPMELCMLKNPLAKLLYGELPAREDDSINYKYDYSFLSRLILAQNPTQDYYNELKNHILSYDNIEDSIRWKYESFINKRKTLVKFKMRGKTLCVYLPLDQASYSDVAVTYGNSNDKKLPMMIKVKSDRTLTHTKELIDIIMTNCGLVVNPKHKSVDYHLEYHTVEEMLAMDPQLVRLIGTKGANKFDEFGESESKGIEYKYNYSFLSRLILAQNPTQDYYNELKNHVLRYDDITDSITWKHELFINKRKTLVKFKMRGKTLCVYLPLDPANYSDVAVTYGNSSDSKLPMMIKVKSNRTLGHTKELIDIVMSEANLQLLKKPITVDYHLEYKTVEEMLNSDPQLVKLNGDKASGKFGAFGEAEQSSGFDYMYNYSFLGRLTLAQNPTQDYYNEVKNHILWYKNVKDNITWRHETFKLGNKVIAILKVKGKTLNVYLPLEYNTYKDLPITCKESSSTMKTTPLDVMIKSNRTLTHTLELIDIVMANYGLEKLNKKPNIDYHLEYHTVKEMLEMNPPLVKLANSKGNKVSFDANEYGVKVGPAWSYKYNYSFLGRLTLASNPAQDYYTEIKNKALCYKDIRDNISWSNERISYKRETVALLKMRGKTLCIYMPLNPADYSDVAVKFENSNNEKLPMMIKLKSPRAVRHTLELIEEVMRKFNIEFARNHDYDYHLEPHTIAEMLVMNPPLVKEANHKYNSISFDEFELGKKNPFDLASRNSYSFEARLTLALEPCQTYYETLKNNLLSYNKVKSNLSWHHEIYKVGRNVIAKFKVKGKTLNVYINLNPEDYNGASTLIIDNRIKHPTSPFASLVKVTSNRKVKELERLFDDMLTNMGLQKDEIQNVNYHKAYKSVEKLAKMGLVKLGKK